MNPWSMIWLVSRTIQNYFPLIWLCGLTATAVWAFTSRIPSSSLPPRGEPFSEPKPLGALAAFVVFLAFYCFIVLYRSGFGDVDDSIITLPIAGAGDDVSSIWPHLGRFFPFGNQEWFYLRQLTTSPLVHQALVVLEALLLVGVLYGVFREFPVRTRLVMLAAVLLAPSLLQSLTGLIFPERNLVLVLALLMLAVQAWDARPTRLGLFAVLGLTHILLYYKEPAFLIVSGFALVRLGIAFQAQAAGCRSLRRLQTTCPVETGMVTLSVLYLAIYVGLMLPHRSTSYTEIDGEPLTVAETILLYLRSNPVFAIFSVALVARLVQLAKTRAAPDRFWDPLAVGVILYAGTYFWFGMRRPYYLAPVDLIGIGYCAASARRLLAAGSLRPMTVAVVGSVVAVLALGQSWFVLSERKNVIEGKNRIIDFLKGELATRPERPLRIHLEHPRGFLLMEFGSLLEARGVSVARSPEQSSDSADVLLESPRTFREGRCVSWIAYRCVHAEQPSPGALMVVLPDDEPSPRGSRGNLRPSRPPAFEYQPAVWPSTIRPALMRLRSWMDPAWRRLYLREDWLAGYVWFSVPRSP